VRLIGGGQVPMLGEVSLAQHSRGFCHADLRQVRNEGE
jgi:hypothetical protein